MINLKKLQSATDRILTSPTLPAGANRADLRCAEVRQWINQDGETGYTVIVSEARPDAHELQAYVAEVLMEEFGGSIEVVTEW